MDWIYTFFDFVRHIDVYLGDIIQNYGTLTYIILSAVIFSETGLVVTAFLPGDSLLFAAGAAIAVAEQTNGGTTSVNIWILTPLLWVAAILGNTVNFNIGRWFGPTFLEKPNRFVKREHIEKTHEFYEKHGAKAIVLSRFLPILRSFVPFVAGIGHMDSKKFGFYNILGATLWVIPILLGGYFLGTIPWVKDNFEWVILGITLTTLLPTLIGVLNNMIKGRNSRKVRID